MTALLVPVKGNNVPAHSAVVLLIEDEQPLVRLCGITLLERTLRILQRLGWSRAFILAENPETIRAHLALPSWARAQIETEVRARASAWSFPGDDKSVLFLRGDFYHDPRLLHALGQMGSPALLVDASPPVALLPLLAAQTRTPLGYLCGAALLTPEMAAARGGAADIFSQLMTAAQRSQLQILNVDDVPSYVVDLRRDLRPLWFPAPPPAERPRAEKLLLDATQNGTLDLPAKIHAPLESWIVARLCRTSITPNQITLCTAVVSACVTFLFATGHFVPGILLALVVGVLDGLDGKQARLKVETTSLGQREHALDYLLELSWWSALAFYFWRHALLPEAFLFLALLVGADLLDRLAKKTAKEKTGRNLDDVAPFDRVVRWLGGRRNIYVWMLAAGLLLGDLDQAFRFLCWWGAGTAAIHLLRAVSIRRKERVPE